jgi:hypothetical protein
MLISNKQYDLLKRLVTVGLPSAATLYFTISQLWGLPYAQEVVGTIAAITTFFGVLMGVSSSSYKQDLERFDGYLELNDGVLEFVTAAEDPMDLMGKDEAVFKVNG